MPCWNGLSRPWRRRRCAPAGAWRGSATRLPRRRACTGRPCPGPAALQASRRCSTVAGRCAMTIPPAWSTSPASRRTWPTGSIRSSTVRSGWPTCAARPGSKLANAYRVSDRLREAETALDTAADAYLAGSGGEAAGVRLLDVQASVDADRRRFDEALKSLDVVHTVHLRLGDPHMAGRALLAKGLYADYAGDPEEAVNLLGKGLGLVDPGRDPGLVFGAVHNLARALMACGRYEEARDFLASNGSEDPGGQVNRLKVRWLEGQIDAGLGELDRAERALAEVRLGFEETGLPYKAALAGLEARRCPSAPGKGRRGAGPGSGVHPRLLRPGNRPRGHGVSPGGTRGLRAADRHGGTARERGRPAEPVRAGSGIETAGEGSPRPSRSAMLCARCPIPKSLPTRRSMTRLETALCAPSSACSSSRSWSWSSAWPSSSASGGSPTTGRRLPTI